MGGKNAQRQKWPFKYFSKFLMNKFESYIRISGTLAQINLPNK